MRTEFLPFARPSISDEDVQAVTDVLRSGWITTGAKCAELEAAFTDRLGTSSAVATTSATAAMHLALVALGIGPGDEVITPSMTWVSTVNMIVMLGATPVFVDVDRETLMTTPMAIEAAITDRTRAIIPVDYAGAAIDMAAIRAIGLARGIPVIEDAAQAFGATYKGKRTCGTLAHVAATSFFPAKPLGCYGDGGAVFTNDDSMADLMKSIRVHGQGVIDKYNNDRIGLNARMDTIQAVILLAKLKIYEDEIAARQRVAATYQKHLAPIAELICPTVTEGNTSVWAQYSLLCDDRATAQAALNEAGIPSAVYYARPMHLQAAFANLKYANGDFPVSEHASDRIFSLPFHPYLEDDTIAHIADTLASAFAS